MKMKYVSRSADTPRAPELELESWGGRIQLAPRADIERVLQLRQAVRDSVDAARRLARLRRAPEAPKPDEDADKN